MPIRPYYARQQLGPHLDNPEVGDDLARRLQLLQRLFRSFLDEVDDVDGQWRSFGTDPLSVALGKLRGLMGIQIGELAALYDLEVSEELATIVPDQVGWFFERFDAERVPRQKP